MKFYIIDSILQTFLISTAASYFLNVGGTPIVATSLDIFELVSKVTIVGLLGLFLYLVNKERTSHLEKLRESYNDLIKQKDQEIAKKDEDSKFWRDKYLEVKKAS